SEIVRMELLEREFKAGVFVAGDEALAVGGESDVLQDHGAIHGSGDRLAGGGVPDPDSMIGAGRGDPIPGRVKGSPGNLVRMAESGNGGALGFEIPKYREEILITNEKPRAIRRKGDEADAVAVGKFMNDLAFFQRDQANGMRVDI